MKHHWSKNTAATTVPQLVSSVEHFHWQFICLSSISAFNNRFNFSRFSDSEARITCISELSSDNTANIYTAALFENFIAL